MDASPLYTYLTYLIILTPVKTEFAKRIKMVDYAPWNKLFLKYPGIIRVNMRYYTLIELRTYYELLNCYKY